MKLFKNKLSFSAPFTLLELVALLAIMLLVTGLVVGNVGRIPTFLSLENTVHKVQYLFARASMMAMAQGKPVTVSYQPGGKVFTINSGGEGMSAGKLLSEKIPEAVGVDFESHEPNYVFFPDGTGGGTPFSLALKGHVFRIRISGLTGAALAEKVN